MTDKGNDSETAPSQGRRPTREECIARSVQVVARIRKNTPDSEKQRLVDGVAPGKANAGPPRKLPVVTIVVCRRP